MKPLNVRYERFMPKSAIAVPRQVILRTIRVPEIESLKTLIEGDHIDEVILCGATICTGWRIHVERGVHFHERPTSCEDDATEQLQAAMRILQR